MSLDNINYMKNTTISESCLITYFYRGYVACSQRVAEEGGG
jgi:hypothetical protein